ncbi:MAG: Restriction endonuclease [uncultured Sulfurovum sp.]|uniref:Restriction endonuclease n=1 Tax=uncultured Sulfurovum sp. TaxID=269237 RepID=A0A6S6SKM5_9BACT|nr:MAG: Restriction endonuclease [uncultured Sulfurovum sp.]
MHLNLYSPLADEYNSNSQKIRVLTETWVAKYIFCPSCGKSLENYKNNKPVADFYCSECSADYELKSKKDTMGKKIVDGAYSTMIERLQSNSNPNFFFLNYDKSTYGIKNFVVIPKHFFIPEIIEKRKPLSVTAQRAGWIGCNILLDTIPDSGKVFYVKNNNIQSKDEILEEWNKTAFLSDFSNLHAKGWLLDIIKCIEMLEVKNFSLYEIYTFEKYLKIKYPENNNIQAKIRQQLQILRDKNYLDFVGRGKYKLK